ncbi:DNA/RNA non-specific endonuclease [Simiaoa sunii]|uniref:DNA/RNA non-specific endonuclease n=2 Tax=Simiaoa sunii TaxID=2763672 RepID=A0A7G9G016_9FIRM|nr:DNA/RNA non-specific endonuclease [Simiaoa sunii]
MKHNRPQKRLITQLSLWLALLLAFTGCAESTVTSQDNTYAIEQLAAIPSELLEASETAVSEPESGQPQENASDTQESQQVTSATDVPTGEGTSAFSLREIPAYSGTPYTEVNGNQPYFTEEELTTQSFETYSELDSLGRCGVAYANVGQDLMPTEPRGEIGAVKPTGWHLVKYDNVDGKYLYNRCHLIAYMLAAENANPQNLITGTRYLNVQGMLPFETKVCDYVKNTGNHVLYRVTPIFDGDNLLADGVLMEAYSVEDAGEGISFCVFAYNVQPGIGIDYATGDNWAEGSGTYQSTVASVAEETPVPQPETDTAVQITPESSAPQESQGITYVLNTNTKKFHYPTCSSVDDMKEKNKQIYTGSREEVINMGYVPCKRCNP